MDPIQQILAQALAPKGSAGNAGSLFIQGAQLGMSRRKQETENTQRQMQLNQEEQRIGLANRRMTLDESKFNFDRDLHPYMVESEKLQAEEARLGIQLKTYQQARNVEIERGNAKAANLLLAMSRNPGLEKDPSFLAEAEKLFSSNFAVAQTENGKTLMGSLLGPRKVKQAFDFIRESNGIGGTNNNIRFHINKDGDVSTDIVPVNPDTAARLKIAQDTFTLREKELEARINRVANTLPPEAQLLIKEELEALSGPELLLTAPADLTDEQILVWASAQRKKVVDDIMKQYGKGVTDMAPGQPGTAADPLGLFSR